MARPSKLSPDITKRIGENIALGLTYALAANSAGVTYQTFHEWHKKGKNSKFGEYFKFYILSNFSSKIAEYFDRIV